MPDPGHFRRLENMYHGSPANRRFEARMHVEEGRAEVTMAVRPEFLHSAGSVHGSVYFKALDDAAFFAVNSLVEDRFVLTAAFHVHFFRAVTQGTLRAAGRVLHRTPKLYVAEAVLHDERGREVARGTGSFVASRRELRTLEGYAGPQV